MLQLYTTTSLLVTMTRSGKDITIYMTIENITILDQELYLLALKKLPKTFLFDDLLNEIHLSRPKFQRKTLRYRLTKWQKAKIISKRGFGKKAIYSCLIDETTFRNSEFICTEKPINLSSNPFIIQ